MLLRVRVDCGGSILPPGADRGGAAACSAELPTPTPLLTEDTMDASRRLIGACVDTAAAMGEDSSPPAATTALTGRTRIGEEVNEAVDADCPPALVPGPAMGVVEILIDAAECAMDRILKRGSGGVALPALLLATPLPPLLGVPPLPPPPPPRPPAPIPNLGMLGKRGGGGMRVRRVGTSATPPPPPPVPVPPLVPLAGRPNTAAAGGAAGSTTIKLIAEGGGGDADASVIERGWEMEEEAPEEGGTTKDTAEVRPLSEGECRPVTTLISSSCEVNRTGR